MFRLHFANELSLICDKAGVNVWELINLANKHPRVNIQQPERVGGHCIAIDPWFIVADFPMESKLIGTASRDKKLQSLLCVPRKLRVPSLSMKSNWQKA
jgi:UDP-N-acetyl-D-mannosaminuronic acid dehydrogenase